MSSEAKLKVDSFRSQFFAGSSLLVCLCFTLYALPLFLLSPKLGALSLVLYRTAFAAAALAHGYRAAYTLKPRVEAALGGARSLPALQAAAPALYRDLFASNAFLYAVCCLTFLLSRPTGMALLPVALLCLLQLAAAASKTPLGQTPRAKALYDQLQARLPVLLSINATAQVAVGLTLLMGLLTRAREVPKTLVYWNVVLRGLYHCGDATVFKMKLPGTSSLYHGLAWKALDAQARPLLNRVPPVQRLVNNLARWFTG
jgi:hypothetical protein